MPGQTRKSTSLTLDRALIDTVGTLGADVRRATGAGIAEAASQAPATQRKDDTRDAFAPCGRVFRDRGIPTATYRQF